MLPRRNLVANFLGQAYVALIGLAFVPVYIDRLGIEAYGLVGFYITLQVWLSLLDLGVTTTITREMARSTSSSLPADEISDLLISLETIVFVIAGAIMIGLWFAAGPIADGWLNPESLSRQTVVGALQAMSLVVASRFCEGIYRGSLFGLERQVFYNLTNSVLSTVRYAGAAILISYLPSIEAFFIWQAGISIVTVGILGVATHCFLPKSQHRARFSFRSLKRISGFAAGMSLTTLFSMAFVQVDKLALSRLVDLENFGLYMIAFALAGAFSMMVSPISAAIFPRLAAAVSAGDSEQERSLFRGGSQIVALLACPALALLTLAGRPVVHAWTDDPILAGSIASTLAFLAIGGFCNSVLQIPFMVQLSHGWTTLSVRVNLIGVILLCPMVYLGVASNGIAGAAGAWALVNIFTLLLATVAMHQHLLRDQLLSFVGEALLVPLIVSHLTVGAVVLAAGPTSGSRLESFGLVLIAGILGFLATALATSMGRRSVRQLGLLALKRSLQEGK